jgi:hypothetical protein
VLTDGIRKCLTPSGHPYQNQKRLLMMVKINITSKKNTTKNILSRQMVKDILKSIGASRDAGQVQF